MRLNDKKASRCAIFVFYDKYGIVDRYITFFLEGLKKCVDRIVVVCNGELNNAGMRAFKTITDEVIVRPNVGYDVTAYKCGLEHISFEKFNDYDEILLTNSTMFGPIYPFEEMFEKMDEKDLDFWGMTVFHKHEGDPFGTIEYGYIPKHIQSFFMVFRKSLTTSEEFKDFWETFPEIKGYKDAVGKFETVFTKKFEQAMEDDFNTADALSAVFEMVKLANVSVTEESAKELVSRVDETLRKLLDVLGILPERKKETLDAEVEALIAERQAARKARNFARADEIRNQLTEMGILLEDTREGVKWKRA